MTVPSSVVAAASGSPGDGARRFPEEVDAEPSEPSEDDRSAPEPEVAVVPRGPGADEEPLEGDAPGPEAGAELPSGGGVAVEVPETAVVVEVVVGASVVVVVETSA